MSISYSWNIQRLECYKQQDGYQNVVYNIMGVLVGTDGIATGVADFAQQVTFSPGGPFTNFQNLTSNQVIGWVESSMTAPQLERLKQAVDADLESKKSNQEILSPPWVGPAT
jgi:hypothetical protein